MAYGVSPYIFVLLLPNADETTLEEGSGFSKIINDYASLGEEYAPRYSAGKNYFTLILKNKEYRPDNVDKADNVGVNVGVNVPVNVGVNVPVNVPVNLSKTAQKVVEYLTINATVTTAVLAQHFGVTERTIKRAIKELREKGLIERVGSDKNGYYKLK